MQMRLYHDLLRYLDNAVRSLLFPGHLTSTPSTG
nr:MAG TPA: hypothetical protein [Bacteriophage sp.]